MNTTKEGGKMATYKTPDDSAPKSTLKVGMKLVDVPEGVQFNKWGEGELVSASTPNFTPDEMREYLGDECLGLIGEWANEDA